MTKNSAFTLNHRNTDSPSTPNRPAAFSKLWNRYLMLEYDSDRYYDYIYLMIALALGFFVTLCSISIIYQDNRTVVFAIYRYLLPFSLYVPGVLYASDLCTLTKNRATGVRLEKRLRYLSREYAIAVPGSLSFSVRTQYHISKVYSYGIVYGFFILVPFMSIVFAQLFVDEVPLSIGYTLLLPFLCWIIYMFAMACNIVPTLLCNRIIKKRLS